MTKQQNGDYEYLPLDPHKVWTTYDLGCSTALVCAGYKLLSLDRNNNPRKALFVFEKADGLDDVVDLYWSNRLEVKALAYFDALKMLKNRLYSE